MKHYILIILLIYIFCVSMNNKTNFKGTNHTKTDKEKKVKKEKKEILFYKCDKFVLGKIVKEVINNNNIKRTHNIEDNWLLFLPCTYNNIESEMKKMDNTKNKILFGIKGCDLLVSKNNLWKLLENKYSRSNAKYMMPETWILSNNKQMELFKNNYSEKNMYIMKKNIQRKEGLLLTNNLEEILNNNDKKFRVVQKYMRNTYMINKRKVNLRIYLLIVYKNNKLTSYYYKNGKCIYTNKDYTGSNELEQNITSLNLDMDIYKKNPFDLFELVNFMDKKKYVILIENIKQNLKKLEIMYRNMISNLNKNNNKNIHFQLFGLDYIFDDDLNVYLLELNKGPDMTSKNDKDYVLKYRIYEDLFNKVGIINHNKKENMFEEII